jgi:hypothetical protein
MLIDMYRIGGKSAHFNLRALYSTTLYFPWTTHVDKNEIVMGINYRHLNNTVGTFIVKKSETVFSDRRICTCLP